MDNLITEETREELWTETDNSIRNLCAGRNYRDHSDEMVEKIMPYIESIIEDDMRNDIEIGEEPNRLAVDTDMVITAMMMYLYEKE